MEIRLISVPYDLGRPGQGKARAPGLFVQHGLADRLQGAGHAVSMERVRLDDAYWRVPGFQSETGAVFKINRALGRSVGASVRAGQWPLVVAGNCNSAVGTLAGLALSRPGIVWFDAHGDFNTPETTHSGYIDGMGLAMAAGRCWQAMLGGLKGFAPVPENCIVHAGASDLDPGERALMQRAGIPLMLSTGTDGAEGMHDLGRALDELAGRTEGIYLHLDMDVLLPTEPSFERVRAAISMIKARCRIAGCGIASYDPSLDPDYHILLSGIDLVLGMV